MDSGNPLISRENVSDALDSLIYSTRSYQPNALEWLLLVEQIAAAPEMPRTPHAREFALHDLLTHVITEQLCEQRARVGLPSAEPTRAVADEKALVERESRLRVPDLLAWSLLYHLYVRADVSREDLAHWMMVNERTLRRYQRYAVRRLTYHLIAEERQARRQYRRQQLYAALPISVAGSFVGRDVQLRQVNEALAASPRKHVFVTGPRGIGKTAFCREVVRMWIDADAFDRVIWIDRPVSAQQVQRHLLAVLSNENVLIDLRRYLLAQPVAVVLDGVDALWEDQVAFQGLLAELSAAFVCMTASAHLPITEVDVYAALPPLSEEGAFALVRDALMGTDDEALWQDIAPDLVARVGGNPALLKQGVRAFQAGEPPRSLVDWFDQRYEQVFDRLPEPARLVWGTLALLPNGQIALEAARALWGERLEGLAVLARHHLLEWMSERFVRLQPSAWTYLRERLNRGSVPDLRAALIAWVDSAIQQDSTQEIAERLLLEWWADLSYALRERWLEHRWQHGLHVRHWMQWSDLLRFYLREADEPKPVLQLAYGMCLRRLSDWQSAEMLFRSAVVGSGQVGDFVLQARILLEWAALLRVQGRYQRAQEKLEQAARNLRRSAEPALLHTLSIEQAQIAIDRGDGESALALLAHVTDLPLVRVLRGEAYHVLREYEACRAQIEDAVDNFADDVVLKPRLLNLLARSYEETGDSDRSESYFRSAVLLLERSHDAFALARARTNLAACLLRRGDFVQAYRLLEAVAVVQQTLGDAVGLAATLHNRRLAQMAIAR